MNNLDFFAPESAERTFVRNGISKTFRIRELSGAEADTIFDVAGRDGKADKDKLKGIDARIIATSISVVDGAVEQAITLDQANRMPAKFRRELVQIAMDVNGLTDKAAEAKAGD